MSHREFDVHLVEKDYVAYNQFVVARAYFRGSGYWITRWIGGLLIVCSVVLTYIDIALLIFAFPFLLLGLFYCFGMKWLVRRSVKSNLKKLLQQGRTDALMGDFVYRVNSDSFESQSKVGYTGTYWGAIDRIEETEDHLFIFNSSISAYIVPKRELTESEFEELKSLVEQYFQAAQDSQ